MPFFSRKSARFMNGFEHAFTLNACHRGFLVNGKRQRLRKKASFQGMATVGGMGKGKSSTFVIPNLLALRDASVVVTDTSGEIYEQTSGHLKSKGYDIQVLNLMDSGCGTPYNPLASLRSLTDVQQAAHLIVSSAGFTSPKDVFWNAGAEKILQVLIQCLKNRSNDDEMNLASVKHLLDHFDAHVFRGNESVTDRFVIESTVNDPATFSTYRGILNGNENTLLSHLATADNALRALANPEIAALTARNGFNFQDLRRKKTAIYVLVRQQDLSFYSFLLSLFYTDMTRTLLSDLSSKTRDVYMLLDEFGHLAIPGFDVFATTARKYQIGFWIFLQSPAQLVSRYGPAGAETIMDGLQTEIYLPGIGIDTAKSLERRLGKNRIPVKHGDTMVVRDENLMNEDQIIRTAASGPYSRTMRRQNSPC